ncbi:MAG: Asp23/Gls24 family envelope stress response protein [Clostridia bacterium]|nr:Asp23/Gls24 family envelope stress response protein [Clostridia bacterium]
MAVENTNSAGFGSVKISDDVIATVSGIAIEDIKGVCGLYEGGKPIAFGLKTPGKSVRAEMKDSFVIVDLDLVVNYGANIPEVAWEVQGKVKKAVESMTGLVVQKVNVNVKDIKIEETPEKEETIEE